MMVARRNNTGMERFGQEGAVVEESTFGGVVVIREFPLLLVTVVWEPLMVLMSGSSPLTY